jgi:hypothetical protein
MESQQAPQMQHAAAAAPAASAGYGADQQAPQVQTAAAHEGTAG